MAFGGVATGNINAQLAASATGIESCEIKPRSEPAIAIIIGTNVAVVAWLLVSSVKKTIKVTMININKMAFMSEVKKDPIQSPSIELLIAPAIDKPPPNNKSIPQAVLLLFSNLLVQCLFRNV